MKIFSQTAVCGIREVNCDEFAKRVRVKGSRSGCPQMPGLYVLSPFYVLKRLEREREREIERQVEGREREEERAREKSQNSK